MITEADYGATDQAMNRNAQAGDETLLVKFENQAKTNEAKSKEAGLPIQEMVTFISIKFPGQRNQAIYREVRPKDKLRFPRHWEAFNQRETLPQAEGTALSEWAGVNAAQVEEFKYFHITTVQELVSVNDTNAKNIRGFYALKEKAQAYLKSAEEGLAIEALEEQRTINAELLARLKTLEENLEKKEKPSKRGRPKKSENSDKEKT